MRGRVLHGFTLVEVTIAMGLVTFVLVALMGLLSVGLGSGREAQVQTLEAMALRQIRAGLQTNTPSGFTGATYYYNYDGSTNASAGGAYLQCQVTVNQPTNSLAVGDFSGVILEFSHPLSGPATNRTTNVFHTSISR